MRNILIGFPLMMLATIGSEAQTVERQRPNGWENLVPGARFMDRFEPSKAIGPLTANCWGADGVKPRANERSLCCVRIKAEPGFRPQEDVEIASLRFGPLDIVAYGGGVRACGHENAGDDLIVNFPALALRGPFAKLLGREQNGRLLFAEMRVDCE